MSTRSSNTHVNQYMIPLAIELGVLIYSVSPININAHIPYHYTLPTYIGDFKLTHI